MTELMNVIKWGQYHEFMMFNLQPFHDFCQCLKLPLALRLLFYGFGYKLRKCLQKQIQVRVTITINTFTSFWETIYQKRGKTCLLKAKAQYIQFNLMRSLSRSMNWRASCPRRRRSLYPEPRRGRRGRPASGYQDRRRSTSCPDTGLPSIGALFYYS